MKKSKYDTYIKYITGAEDAAEAKKFISQTTVSIYERALRKEFVIKDCEQKEKGKKHDVLSELTSKIRKRKEDTFKRLGLKKKGPS
jgi:hypothetical protein